MGIELTTADDTTLEEIRDALKSQTFASVLEAIAALPNAPGALTNNGTGTFSYTPAVGTGTVTSTSVVSANGFAGTVATSATTPAITITTTITGMVKGNGAALLAAVADTDYLTPATASTTYVPQTRTINGQALTGNISLNLTGVVTSTGNATSIADGALALSKLGQSGATNGQVATWNGSAWAPATPSGGGGATNLAYTASATNGIVASSTGTDATIPLGTGTNAGLLAPSQFTKLSNLSGINTGDQDLSGYLTIVDAGNTYGPILTPDGDYLTPGTAATTYVPLARTINGQSLSGDVTLTTITGNAGTATTLQTPRNINGVSFNGGADITVAAAAGTLTGSTLASGVTVSSLTSLGAITGAVPGTVVGTSAALGIHLGTLAGTARVVWGTGTINETWAIDNDVGMLRWIAQNQAVLTLTPTGLLTASSLSVIGTASFAAGSIANAALATDPLARSNHTGMQAWSTLTSTPTSLSGYGISGSLADFNTALTGADFASLAGAEALTNKSVNGVNLVSGGTATKYLSEDGTYTTPAGGGGGSGTVTSVSVTTANGVSGSVDTATTTPAITLTLGAITPTSVSATGALTSSQSTDAATIVNGAILSTSALATVGAQKWSPSLLQRSSGWGTTLGAQSVDFYQIVRPTQGAAPTGTWALQSSINGSTPTDRLTVTSTGAVVASASFSVGNSSLGNTGVVLNLSSASLTISGSILGSNGAANLRQGPADAAAPTAQTFSTQSVVAGTGNTAGVNRTISGSQGTGTGAGGSIILSVATAGSSGSAQNALATAVEIRQDKAVFVANVSGTPATPTGGGILFVDGGALKFIGSSGTVTTIANP